MPGVYSWTEHGDSQEGVTQGTYVCTYIMLYTVRSCYWAWENDNDILGQNNLLLTSFQQMRQIFRD